MSFRVLVPLVVLSFGFLDAMFAQDAKSSPAANLEDVAWIAGHWSGEAMGGTFEETWNPPMGGSMMGMFKFVQNDAVGFYEILTIVPRDKSLLLRLKHFDASLKGWEEKDKSVEFPLVEITENEVRFDGLVFKRISQNEMSISVTIREGEAEPREVVFKCQRVAQKK